MSESRERAAKRAVPEIHWASSAEMRRQLIEEYYLPVAEHVLQKDDRVDAVMLCFAQYWDDEADDAVHARLLPLADRRLTFREAYTWKNLPFILDEDLLDDEAWDEDTEQRDDHREWIDVFELLYESAKEIFEGWSHWDNDLLITAFASFTKEGSDQDMHEVEAFTPYALFVRAPTGGAHCQIVGELLRPHLEDKPGGVWG